MQHIIIRVLGALLLGVCVACASDNVAGTAPDAGARAAVAKVHDHAASNKIGGSGMHYHGKLVLDPMAPASFSERPAEGTHFTCPVSGGVFEVEPHTRVSFYEGRHYAFCCGGCAQDFDADPAFFVNRVKEAEAAQ